MKYSDLIQFDPIDTVVQLREADAAAQAAKLVGTFVISERMRDVMKNTIFAHLQFNDPFDNRGLMVVGNYGTGKSHLMAVVSAIAEHADLAGKLTDAAVVPAAHKVAGKFKVIRDEIGSTTMSLRDIVCQVLEKGLKSFGVEFKFPPTNERHENKTALQEMMAAFQHAYPDKGLVLVLDELLDYLRGRQDQAIVLDLAFLREVGEVTNGTRFRFIAGVQESLFDNPRFQFIADPLRRVKDRFEQVRIARDDVAYVVANRLLKKTATQEAEIREHLTKFAPLFGSMTERMDEFVRLFPVHPAYLDVFERVSVAEKREVLKTLSVAIAGVIEKPVPTDDPGLIAYDSYWANLTDNPSFRTQPDIKEVIERSKVLEGRISQAFPKAAYKPAALRIIHALSVHRLTTSDIYVPIGVTAADLRDDLCVMLPVPKKDAEFLKTIIETIMGDIVKTVSGQFISHNRENGDYYLDLKKDVDFDAIIEKRGDSLDPSKLDDYYFDALRRLILENPDAPQYVPGYRIWEHDLEWSERRAGRSGYLFFGAPNQRSTAQPPRDFYLYFLQIFDVQPFEKENKPDEVFFRLVKRDDVFDRALRLYASARELWIEASTGNKPIYEQKANAQLKRLTSWLSEQTVTAVEVTYQGKTKTLNATVQGKLPKSPTIRDYVNVAGSLLLGAHFANIAPQYPVFSVNVTRANRQQTAQEGLRWIAGGVKSKQGTAVLDAFELLDGETLRPRNSKYANGVMNVLNAKSAGQVVNRSELVSEPFPGVETWTAFAVEPEFLVVVLAALVYNGDIVLSLPGKKIDAGSLDQLTKVPFADVLAFKHLEKPKDLPLGALKDLCELLGVAPGLMMDPSQREEGVARIHGEIAKLLNRTVTVDAKILGMEFWGNNVGTSQERKDWQDRLAEVKGFLEKIQPFNSAGKLKNFPFDSPAIAKQKPGLAVLAEIEGLLSLIDQMSPLTNYLGKAEIVLDKEHSWQDGVRTLRAELRTKIDDPAQRSTSGFRQAMSDRLSALKEAYKNHYLDLHMAARLGVQDDKKKAKLLKDSRLVSLRSLSHIEVMPRADLRSLENQLAGLRSCFAVTADELDKEPVCPHPNCRFQPSTEPVGKPASDRLREIDEKLDTLVEQWTMTLLENLADPSVAANVDLVDAKARAEIEAFRSAKKLPDAPSPAFVKALQDVFGGLQRVAIGHDGLTAALSEGGMPCTVIVLKERFETYLKSIVAGKDQSKVRIVIE